MVFSATQLTILIVLIAVGISSVSALTITLGGTVDITQILNMMGNKITNVGTPTASTDAATKGYVDSVIDCDEEAIASLVLSNIVTPTSCALSVSTLDNNGDVGRASSMAIGTDGFPVISYWDKSNNNLKFIHCNSVDCSTFDTPFALDNNGAVGQFSSMAIGTDGFPVIGYTDGTNSGLKVIHCTDIDCSTADTPTLLDSGSVGFDPSLKIGVDGFPVVSYSDWGNSNLKFVHCKNISCSGGVGVGFDTPLTLDSGTSVGFHTSLAIGSDTFPIIAYLDFGNTNLKVVHCTSVDCSTKDTPLTLDNNGNVGRLPSIAIRLDEKPVIAYHDKGNQQLKLGVCGSADCSFLAVTNVISDIGNTDPWPSVTIGADGKIVISFFDATIGSLKMAHCDDHFCNGKTVEVVDNFSGLDQGAWGTSLAIGTDRLPVITYLVINPLDPNPEFLKFAHCGDKRCIFD